MDFERKRMLHVFAAARNAGPYDELPVLRDGIDPQVHLSRNDQSQPFFLICGHDTVVAQLTGTGSLDLRYSDVRVHRMEPGDLVYVPAGTPTRYLPAGDTVVLRYKALEAGMEAVCWFCPACGEEIHRDEFDTGEEIPQDAYWRACREFNAKEELRTCPACSAVHPPVELEGIRWPDIAQEIRGGEPVP